MAYRSRSNRGSRRRSSGRRVYGNSRSARRNSGYIRRSSGVRDVRLVIEQVAAQPPVTAANMGGLRVAAPSTRNMF